MVVGKAFAYAELFDTAFGKDDAIVGHVDEEVAVACANAAVAFYNCCAGVVEWWGGGHCVAEGAAAAQDVSTNSTI
jgi:hypothetical protein